MSASRAEAAWDDEWSRVVFDLCRKKEQSMNKSHSVFLVFCLTMAYFHSGCDTSWKASCASGSFTVGALGDHQRLLPSSLLPWGRVCVLLLCLRVSVCVCACASVFSVTLHQSHEVRWDCVWFLIPGKSGQLQRLTQIPWCETHTRLNTQTALVIYFFFFWV